MIWHFQYPQDFYKIQPNLHYNVNFLLQVSPIIYASTRKWNLTFQWWQCFRFVKIVSMTKLSNPLILEKDIFTYLWWSLLKSTEFVYTRSKVSRLLLKYTAKSVANMESSTHVMTRLNSSWNTMKMIVKWGLQGCP